MSGGAIRKELTDAAKLTPKRGEVDATFLIRLQKAISEDITEDEWNALSPEAQDWNNQAADDITKKHPIQPFADEKEEEPAPSTRRRGATASTPAATAFTPKLGDNVLVTTKRGKVVQGIIVDMDPDSIVLNADGDKGDQANDVEVALEGATITPSNTAEAAAIEGQAAQAGAGAVEDESRIPPEVGDSIKVETARGKTVIGKIIELNGDDLVLKDSTGEEHEMLVSKLKSFEIKSRGKGNGVADVKKANDDAPTKRGSATGGGDEADKPKRSSNEPGVSVGNRIRDMLFENPKLTDEQIGAQLTKEKIEFRPPTVKMIGKDTRYMLEKIHGSTDKAADKAEPATTTRRGRK